MPHQKALAIREDVGFFQAVRAVLAKGDDLGERKTMEEIDHAIRPIVSRAVASEQVIDIFEAAGVKKPDISILSEHRRRCYRKGGRRRERKHPSSLLV